jgi:hypothetical protein
MWGMWMGESGVDAVTSTVSNLVDTISMGAHVARSSQKSTIGIISLFNEAYLFSLALTLQRNIIHYIDASIDVLLLWQKALENEFFVILIQSM